MDELMVNVTNQLSNIAIKPDKVEEEFERDFGSRLRLMKGPQLIQEAGNQLHCTIITIAKAQVLFHRFQKLNKNIELDYVHLAAVCLNLSIKLCDDDVKFEDVVKRFYHVAQDLKNVPNPMRPDPPPEELKRMKRNVILIEYSVCRIMAFKFNCEIAHTFIYKFLAQLQCLPVVPDYVIVSMSSSVTKLLSTYYMCPGCLDFEAKEIALAGLQFAFLFHGILDPSVKYIMKKELKSLSNKERIYDILDELILVSDVSTTLKYL